MKYFFFSLFYLYLLIRIFHPFHLVARDIKTPKPLIIRYSISYIRRYIQGIGGHGIDPFITRYSQHKNG